MHRTQHLLQKNGGGRGGRAFGHDREVCLGDKVRRVDQRQLGIKELDKGLAGAPVGAAVGDRHTRTSIELHGGRLSTGNKVILNGKGMFLADDSRIQRYDISDKQRLLQLSNCSADYV